MLTLIIPTLLRDEDLTLNLPPTPSLDRIVRFASKKSLQQSTAALYSQWLTGNIALDENCVFASPVWQQMGLHSASLLDGSALAISDEEAQTLCQGLNQFYETQYQFTPLRPDLWQLKLPQQCQWRTPDIFSVCGQIHSHSKAEGEGSRQWLKLQTEIQMWLFSHPINQARQSQNQPPINGIWLWNNLPTATPHQLPQLIGSNSPWRLQAALPTAPLPEHLAHWFDLCQAQHIAPDQTHLFLDNLLISHYTADIWAYHDALTHLEQQFFTPLWQALKQGKISAFRLINETHQLTITPKSHWAFWRPKRAFNGHSL